MYCKTVKRSSDIIKTLQRIGSRAGTSQVQGLIKSFYASLIAIDMDLEHGRRKGFLDFENFNKKGGFLSVHWEKRNFTTLDHLEKSPSGHSLEKILPTPMIWNQST